MNDPYKEPGYISPSPECELPEPIRPEGDAGLRVTATCPHCEKRFLLVNASREVYPTGERWLEAESYWEEWRKFDKHIHEVYRDQPSTFYKQYVEEDYGVGGFDYPSDFYIEPPKNFRKD